MKDDQEALAGFGGTARLFPLPSLVLFPHVVQGLHIFEPRYRSLIDDALAGDNLIALVLLKPGWEEEYDGRPEIEPVACLGRIGWREKLPDGRYNLRLRGLCRAMIVEEIPTNHMYRTARAELVPDVTPADLEKRLALRLRLEAAIVPRFAADAAARQQLTELFDGDMPLGQLCDILSYSLPLPLELKQALLGEPHVDIRAEIVLQALAASAAKADRRFPPDFSPN